MSFEIAGQVALAPDGFSRSGSHFWTSVQDRDPDLRLPYLGHAALQDPYNTLFRDLTEAVMIMRAQRHDMINDLTLASTYLQMNRIEDAEQCIAVIAADLSDRYNYATLPKDAWYQVIAAKSDIARSQGVDFRYRLDAPMPDDFHQRRPAQAIGIFDNAIDAWDRTRGSLEWSRTEAGTVLRVFNSVFEIPYYNALQPGLYQGQ